VHDVRTRQPVVDTRPPSEIACAAGFAVTAAACVVLSVANRYLGSDRLTTDVVVLALVVAAFAWFVRPVAAVVVAVLGWLILNGFLVDQFGTLRWHGEVDAARLAVLIIAAAAGCLLHARGRLLVTGPGVEATSQAGRLPAG
jgi:K+-sensing histidine kinase KdpD